MHVTDIHTRTKAVRTVLYSYIGVGSSGSDNAVIITRQTRDTRQ